MDGGAQGLLPDDWKPPTGYTVSATRVAVRIEASYPDTQLDMVYVNPPVVRADGRLIKALSAQRIDGQDWQRWSRRRTPQNPWRPGEDDVASHLVLVEHWFETEVNSS